MTNILSESLGFFHNHVMFLNNSKFFAGIIMILLNVGSKFIGIQLSRSTVEYLKMNITKQIWVFAMAWMGTRDIYTSLVLTAGFTVLSDHLFNEESPSCVVPKKYRILTKIIDKDGDGVVSDSEINNAIAILEKAKQNKTRNEQRKSFLLFNSYIPESNTN